MTVEGLFIDIGVPKDYLRLRDNADKLNAILKEMDVKKKEAQIDTAIYRDRS